MGPYVVVDVETTGLDTAVDEVIQIALKHSDGREWSTFVDPGRPVPDFIRRLTGFTDVDFSRQPLMDSVRGHVESFLDGARMVGHNVAFDAAFLARAGVLSPYEPVDTLAWSRLAFPLKNHHGLADWFGGEEPGLHDARVDVRLTDRLLHQIYQRVCGFSVELKRDLARLLGREWDWWDVPMADGSDAASPLYRPAPDLFDAAPLPTAAVNDEVDEWLGVDGLLARTVLGFEARPAQQQMAQAVRRTMDDGDVLLVEAGTGTGKSLAYLTPAMLRALGQGERVVVATHTVALQEQLWLKDVPQLATATPLNVALVKGRGRYLCLYKASEVIQDSAVLGETSERRWALATLLTFMEQTTLGDVEEFPLKHDGGRALWREVMADSHSCAGPRCPYAGPCFMRQSRHLGESSHLVIVNHALLASHVANGNILPPFSHLIVDEAHHFGEVLENTLGFELNSEDWERRFRDANHHVRGVFSRLGTVPEVAGSIERIRSGYHRVDGLIRLLSSRMEAATPPGEYERRSVRVTDIWRDLLADSGIWEVWRDVVSALAELTDWGNAVYEEAEALGASDQAPWLRFRQWQQEIAEAAMGLALWGGMSDERVSWWEVRPGRRGEMVSVWRWAPVEIADIVREKLWSQVHSAVLTSATLSVRGRFDYVAAGLGIPQARRAGLKLMSPFDWENQVRLIVPEDSPHPADAGYLDEFAALVAGVAEARGGRTLVLLTSYRAVEGVSWRIRERLDTQGIRTMAQNIDGPSRRLVSEFRQNPRSVLVGTMTYWEGVDIPGDDLQVVMMGRLPFRAPGDPLEEAKLDRIRDRGQSPFYHRSLPEAVLRFQQGFGRLIRTQHDRGVVIVFDPRVQPARSRYGQVFLDALSEVPREIVPLDLVVSRLNEFWGGIHAHPDK